MSRRCALVATVPWLALAAVLTPRATRAARRRFWRALTDTTNLPKEH